MAKLLHRALTQKIIGVYYDVYNGLGHTYPEFIYENAMVQELQRSGIRCVRQDEYQISYQDQQVGVQQLDIFVAGAVVVEVKVKPNLTLLDQAQTISYLKTTGCQVGLLFNFGGAEPTFKRLFFNPTLNNPSPPPPAEISPDLLFPEISHQVIGGLFAVHNALGPGFIHRIYTNACYHEMQTRGLAVAPQREMIVFYRGRPIGTVKLGHLQIENKLMVFPVAVRDIQQIKPGNLRRWMVDQEVALGILANFSAERLELVFLKTGS